MSSCVVIANKIDLIKTPYEKNQKEKKLRETCEYFDIYKYYKTSFREENENDIKLIFKDICEYIWNTRLNDSRFFEEFKVCSKS